MKNFFRILFFAISICQIAFPQIVTTTPTYPTQNDSITVYFDATQPGASELLNYTGAIYAHTGVTVDSLGVIKDWQWVIAPWSTNISKAALTKISTNYYKLVIGYPRQYYHVTNPNVKIIKLDFVFRSSDGSKQTRPDIFYSLYESGLTLVVNNPQVNVKFGDPQRSPFFVIPGDTIPINISAATLGTKISSLNLYVDDNQVAQSDSALVSYKFAYTDFSAGAHKIKAVGIDTLGIKDSTTFMMFCNPPINYSPLPVGIKPGINYTGPTTATLALFAPHKNFIYVLGDFNDWKVETNYFMNCDSVNSDSVIWWVNLTSLSPGTEYAFQYLADGKIRTGDPYSEKILDPWNDPYIPSTTYPNLKTYPIGKTESIVSVLQTAQGEYNWQVPKFQKPSKEKLVIYELLVRDFSVQQNFQFLIDTLSYLKNLGVNAIELMPIMEFSGNNSWGYNPIYHTAVDKYYGPANKLKEFIDLCHQNGMAVILDMVLNQADNLSPLAMLWWDNANNRPAANNPYLNPIARHPFNVFNDFNHESNATKYFVDRVNEYWLTKFKFDGFRFDLSKGFTQTYTTDVNAWSAYDQSRINILERMANKIWQVDSTAYVILEHFAVNTEETVLSNYGMMLWDNENYNYNEATMGYVSNFSGISYKSRSWSKPNLVGYMESHDEERLMYKNLQFGNSYGSYNIKSLGEALNRMKLAAAFFFTVPGPKMLWEFGELGYDYSIFYDPGINGVPQPYGTSYARTYPKPVKWNYLTDARRIKLYKVFKTLIELKKNYEAFSSDVFFMNVSDTVKKINLYHPSMDVFIIGNFGVKQTTANQSFSKSGWWYDYFNADSINVTNISAPITLQPGEFKIYTSAKLPAPEADLLTEVKFEQPLIIKEYKLEQNYPNPFNPSTKITWQAPVNAHQTLKVYDVLGNEIATLVDEYKTAGKYEVEFSAKGGSASGGNAIDLPSGVYFYRLQVGDFVSTKKMILLK